MGNFDLTSTLAYSLYCRLNAMQLPQLRPVSYFDWCEEIRSGSVPVEVQSSIKVDYVNLGILLKAP